MHDLDGLSILNLLYIDSIVHHNQLINKFTTNNHIVAFGSDNQRDEHCLFGYVLLYANIYNGTIPIITDVIRAIGKHIVVHLNSFTT